jgi:hypothetical protein
VIAKHFRLGVDASVGVVPSASALPSALVIQPGHYTVAGVTYDCTEEGLYCFWNPMQSTQNRIVYSSDVDALMSAVAWLVVNGRSDDIQTDTELTSLALNYRLRLLCGKAVSWTKALCESLGIQSRVCKAVTSHTPTGYYDGHVLLEVMVGGTWRLYDISNDIDN